MNDEIRLGDLARDTITGFEGVVVGITQWLHGCRRFVIQPRELKDGKPIETQSFDEPQLVLVQRRAVLEGSRATGGPRPEPVRRPDARS